MKTYSYPFVILLLSFIGLNRTKAQIGEARNDFVVGVNGGICLNTVSFDPTIKQGMHSGITTGLTFRYTSEKYFKTLCSIQVELNYAQLGWKEEIMNSRDEKLPDTYQRNMNYIQLPMMARLGWGKENRGLLFYILAGPQIGFCLGENSEQSNEWTLNGEGNPDRPNNMYAQYDMAIKNKFDYGITAGLGLELNTGIGHFTLEGRYYYGLSDLFGNAKKDVFSRSANGAIYAKIAYLINVGKGNR